MSPSEDESQERIRLMTARPAARASTTAPRWQRAVLRKSRTISLAIAVLLLALSIDFLTEALRKNESVEDGAGLESEPWVPGSGGAGDSHAPERIPQ